MRDEKREVAEFRRAIARTYNAWNNPENIEPWKLELFCIQVAWTECPVFPFVLGWEKPCIYLTDPQYEGYVCPNLHLMLEDPLAIFWPIIREGTDEQRQALEQLADMFVRYYTMDNPPWDLSDECPDRELNITKESWVDHLDYIDLRKPGGIHTLNPLQLYRRLGLEHKVQTAAEQYQAFAQRNGADIIIAYPSLELVRN